MGVDYDAYYGIGYQVKLTDEILSESPDPEDIRMIIDDLNAATSTPFNIFMLGNGFSGEVYGHYFTLSDPFTDGLDLTDRPFVLRQEIARLKLEIVGDFGLVGGIDVS